MALFLYPKVCARDKNVSFTHILLFLFAYMVVLYLSLQPQRYFFIMERKVITGSIEQLVQDDKNFNQHTEYGMSLLEKSLRQHGAARGIVVDKNNRIIGGNGIVETATQIGLDKIVIVETTGDELVVTKRTDIDLDSREGREMAMADNATASADLKWDAENIEAAKEEYEINPEDWGVHDWMMDSPDLDEDGVNSLFESAEGVANKKNPTITIEVPQSYDIDEVKDGLREYLAAFAGCVVR